ncbi:MAG: glycosyltransferase family 4 protein [Deltaproteobacteria bacterium]
MKKNKPRVALVTNVLAHYRVPCFQQLAEQMPGQLTFFLLAEKMEHRHYVMAQGRNDLPVVRLPGWKWSRFPHDDLHLNDVRPVLRGNYDVVILGGWDEPTYLLLWICGVVQRQKILFWVELTANETPRSGVKERYKKFLLGQASGSIVPGIRAFQYCQQLGQPGNQIFTAPNAANRAFFRGEADRLLPLREDLRREEELRGLVILFVGRLVEPLKRVSILIKACGQLERSGKKLSLLIAGDGPERRFYQELGRSKGLTDVRFLGTLEHETLCRYYAMADVLVLPSQEVWGFVLNEGMEFGLPLIVSEAVGAGPDLVRSGENGFVIPVGDTLALAKALEVLAEDEALRHRMGQASRSIIEKFSPENWANGVMQAIEAVMK